MQKEIYCSKFARMAPVSRCGIYIMSLIYTRCIFKFIKIKMMGMYSLITGPITTDVRLCNVKFCPTCFLCSLVWILL